MAVAIYTSLLTLDEAPSGTVTVYDAGTTTPRAIYTDPGLSVAATNPIPLDSAGRSQQGMIYTAATAYKVVVKNASGVTLYTRDNIDPGVPLGTGVLAIPNGGTGATTPEAALANLGGATAQELAGLSEDVASVVSALGSTEKTHIATGTSAQRPNAPEFGDMRANSDTTAYEAYKSSAWVNFKTSDEMATQADMEAASSSTKIVPPSLIKSHPGVAKAWGLITVTAGVPALTVGYNISSITDGGVGNFTVNFTTAFSSSDFAAVVSAVNGAAQNQVFSIETHTRTTGSVLVRVFKAENTGSTDRSAFDCSFTIACYGDQ